MYVSFMQYIAVRIAKWSNKIAFSILNYDIAFLLRNETDRRILNVEACYIFKSFQISYKAKSSRFVQ